MKAQSLVVQYAIFFFLSFSLLIIFVQSMNIYLGGTRNTVIERGLELLAKQVSYGILLGISCKSCKSFDLTFLIPAYAPEAYSIKLSQLGGNFETIDKKLSLSWDFFNLNETYNFFGSTSTVKNIVCGPKIPYCDVSKLQLTYNSYLKTFGIS